MSISGISSSDYLYQYLYRINNTQTDSLTSSLTSSQSKGTAASVTGSSSGKDQIATDLSALWEALQSGNLTSAQTYFAQLQQDMKAFGASASDSTQSTSTTTASSSVSDSNPFAKDLSALGEALQSGDLTSAQSIFSNIMQHMQPPPPPPDATSSVSSSSNASTLADDLSKLEEALNSGNLTGAQSAFTQIMQDVQSISASASDSTQSTSTTTASSSVSDSNPLAKDLSKLEEALNSGDLTSAQSIFAQIMQHMQPPDATAFDSTQSTSTTTASSSVSTSNSLADDLAKLEEALNSGDLTSAQTAFTQIMQHMPPPPDINVSDSTQSTSAVTASSSGTENLLSKMIDALLSMYNSYDTASKSSKSYYA